MRFFLILLCFCLLGCSKNQSENQVLKLQASGEFLRIPIDSLTANISTGLVRYEDYLVNVNWNSNSLQFYDLNSKTLTKEITYPSGGPDGVAFILGFSIQSMDSIFLFPPVEGVITLSDGNGKIKNRIEYQIPEGHTNAFVHNAYFGSAPILQNGKMLVKTHTEGNYRQMTEDRLNKSLLAYGINLEDGSYQSTELTYPEGYLNSGLKFFEPSLVFHPEYTVYSLFGDHRIFKESKNGIFETFDGKSQYLDESLPYFPIDRERFETQKYLTASSRYETLVYDEFRKLYYRFAYPTLAIENEEDLLALRENPGPFVIQVFNEDLTLITESYFEGGIYFPNNHFITEKGLYLSANNPENPKVEEDAFRFELIELVD